MIQKSLNIKHWGISKLFASFIIEDNQLNNFRQLELLQPLNTQMLVLLRSSALILLIYMMAIYVWSLELAGLYFKFESDTRVL